MNVSVPIKVLSTTKATEKEFKAILEAKNKPIVVGLDAEWKPNQVKGEKIHPVAILQIATPSTIYIIQLLYLDGGIPESLKQFLADPTIIKTGVGIIMDARKLHRDHNLDLRGCVELYVLSKKLKLSSDYGAGLKSLTNHFVHLSIPKSKQIQLSDWSVKKLAKKQVYYAAADAWAGLLIFEQMFIIYLSNENQKGNNEFISFANWWENPSATEIISTWTKDCLEKKSQHSGNKIKNLGTPKTEKEWKGSDEVSCRKTPLYDGCQMLAPDGTHITYCNKDKVKWYLDKGIAELVPGSEPAVIKLKFFPSGKTGSESLEAQLQDRETANRCVICGNSNSYQKFYVVPRCYRQYFPSNEKFHCSHDIILLCPSCHYSASHKLEEFKETVVSKKYNIPVNGIGESYLLDSEGALIAATARQLQKNKKKMTQEQIEELELQIMKYFNCSEITEDILEKAASIKFKTKNPDYVSHGEAVVKRLLEMPEQFELQKFVFMWRKFFEEEFKPKHLPRFWDPNHEWQEQHGNGSRKAPYF